MMHRTQLLACDFAFILNKLTFKRKFFWCEMNGKSRWAFPVRTKWNFEIETRHAHHEHSQRCWNESSQLRSRMENENSFACFSLKLSHFVIFCILNMRTLIKIQISIEYFVVCDSITTQQLVRSLKSRVIFININKSKSWAKIFN